SVGGLQTKVEQKKEATDNAEGDPTVKIDSKIKQSIAEKPSLGPSPGLSTLNGKKMADLKELNKELKEVLKKNDMLSKVMMKVEDRGLIVGLLTDKLLFNLGEADLKDDSVEILNVITPVLKKYANPIRIEGNTCDLPIYTERFHSNWELSAMRAINVGQYLIVKKNINPDRVSVIGYGEYRPMFPNDTEENRSRNRRVDLVISKGNQMLYVEDPFEEKDEGKPAKPRTESSPEGNEPQVPVNEADFWENFVEGR
ncbi:MAG: flagellar motor protein MotB, partial [Vulcanimicrobiota bacterium]